MRNGDPADIFRIYVSLTMLFRCPDTSRIRPGNFLAGFFWCLAWRISAVPDHLDKFYRKKLDFPVDLIRSFGL